MDNSNFNSGSSTRTKSNTSNKPHTESSTSKHLVLTTTTRTPTPLISITATAITEKISETVSKSLKLIISSDKDPKKTFSDVFERSSLNKDKSRSKNQKLGENGDGRQKITTTKNVSVDGNNETTLYTFDVNTLNTTKNENVRHNLFSTGFNPLKENIKVSTFNLQSIDILSTR